MRREACDVISVLIRRGQRAASSPLPPPPLCHVGHSKEMAVCKPGSGPSTGTRSAGSSSPGTQLWKASWCPDSTWALGLLRARPMVLLPPLPSPLSPLAWPGAEKVLSKPLLGEKHREGKGARGPARGRWNTWGGHLSGELEPRPRKPRAGAGGKASWAE